MKIRSQENGGFSKRGFLQNPVLRPRKQNIALRAPQARGVIVVQDPLPKIPFPRFLKKLCERVRSVFRLGHSLSDALVFGPLELVYGRRITRVSECILHHVSSHHMTILLRSPCVSRRASSVRKEKSIEYSSRTAFLGGTRFAVSALVLLLGYSCCHCCFHLR